MGRQSALAGMWRAFGSPWADVALAVLLTIVGQLELRSLPPETGSEAARSLLLLAQTGAVAVRRTHTLAAVAVSVGAMVGEVAIGAASNTLAGLVAGLVISYSVGRHLVGRTLVLASTVIALALAVHIWALPAAGAGDFAFAALFTVIAWVMGRGARSRRRERIAAEREAALRSGEQEALVAAAVAEERARIAREMHDVVAHGMSVMVVQAAAAEHLLDKDPDRAREPLASVRQTGQESLAEMRRLLGLLRTDADDSSGRAPQPTLGQVPALVEQLRDAGMPITLDMTGADLDVPAGIGLCAFRIVQESLTNALKHAAGAATAVRVRRDPDRVELTIRNDPPPAQPEFAAALPGGANGISGMRERVSIYGGSCEAKPTADGGFLVHATLPIPR